MSGVIRDWWGRLVADAAATADGIFPAADRLSGSDGKPFPDRYRVCVCIARCLRGTDLRDGNGSVCSRCYGYRWDSTGRYWSTARAVLDGVGRALSRLATWRQSVRVEPRDPRAEIRELAVGERFIDNLPAGVELPDYARWSPPA